MKLDEPAWSTAWRGHWIWDVPPDAAPWWIETGQRRSHFTYLRKVFDVPVVPPSLPVRVTCDSRYLLFVNGIEVGRGPVRDEPAFLGWDEHDLVPHLRVGENVVVSLCRYYGFANPWWLPATQSGTLGSGSFCFETHPDAAIELISDATWQAVPAPWLESEQMSFHGVPPEVVDGRQAPAGIHDPEVAGSGWPAATLLRGRFGGVADRPPAAPYTAPLQRSIPQLASRLLQPRRTSAGGIPATADANDDPIAAWRSVREAPDSGRTLTMVDIGALTLGHVRLRVAGAAAGERVLLAVGEDLRDDGLPEIDPRRWVALYVCRGGSEQEEVTFFDPVGFRYLAVLHPTNASVQIEVDERLYPRPDGARFDCDDERYVRLWKVGARTVDLCSADAFVDCPGREQRAWLGDAHVQGLVSFVTNPDWRLAKRQLALEARSRRPDGLLAMAAACDVTRAGTTIPDFSLHWIRALASYWLYSGDEEFVRTHVPVAEAIIERYEASRTSSGLLENFPGWVFIEWAQIGRDIVTAAHDALYAVALNAYATLPGAEAVDQLVARTASAFEALWDPTRGVYVDTIGQNGPGRRVSQHTNAAALLAGLVPDDRVARVIEGIVDPGPAAHGGRLVVTATPADAPELGADTLWQEPAGFDAEVDVVACQPFFCHVLHQALHHTGRADLILPSLLRWHPQTERGTFQEYWDAPPGTSSRCHGWAACPTYDLVSYVLGVRPVAPGYTRAVVEPCLGHLRRATGRVPTPRGWLGVGVADGIVSLEVPEGTVVEIGGQEVRQGVHRVELNP